MPGKPRKTCTSVESSREITGNNREITGKMTVIAASEDDVVIASEPSFQVGSIVANPMQKARRGGRPGFFHSFFRLRFLARVAFLSNGTERQSSTDLSAVECDHP
jgi:hypothetical protein